MVPILYGEVVVSEIPASKDNSATFTPSIDFGGGFTYDLLQLCSGITAIKMAARKLLFTVGAHEGLKGGGFFSVKVLE